VIVVAKPIGNLERAAGQSGQDRVSQFIAWMPQKDAVSVPG